MGLSVLCCYTAHNPDSHFPLQKSSEIPYGFALIATLLKQAGHQVQLLVLSPSEVLDESFRSRIGVQAIDLICFSCVSSHFPLVKRITSAFREAHPSSYIVVGGAHATVNPNDTISHEPVDAVCVGEGEAAILELAAQLESGRPPSKVVNCWLKENSGSIQQNQRAQFIDDLNVLPSIDRAMWDPWIKQPDLEPAVIIGRGCPNSCKFCSNRAFRRISEGNYVRFRRVSNIIREIFEIIDRYETDYIYLETETLSCDLDFTFELCDALAKLNMELQQQVRFRGNFSLTAKIARDHKLMSQLFMAFVRAKILHLNVGLESGSERIRRLMGKPYYTNDDFLSFCRIAQENGLGVRLYVMIGLPDETLFDWKETVHVVKKSQPEDVALSIFFPYPGTEAYEMVKREGLLKKEISDFVLERQKVVIDLPKFSRRRIMLEHRLFERKVLAINGPWKSTWHHRILISLLSQPILGYSIVFLVDKLNDTMPGIRKKAGDWFVYSYHD
ncbi:MAG: radical SAM protein [Desulfomonile sp.]